MTDWLSDYAVHRMGDGYCPDCGHRRFVLGPCGGAATNVECGGCGSRFNVMQLSNSHRIVMAHRIPRQDQGGTNWRKDGSDA